MDKTDSNIAGPGLRSPKGGGGSQSRLSATLFWVLLAAILFRIVTTVTDKDKKPGGEGLVRWEHLENAPALSARAGKPILYDFTAAWCAPCHKLDKEAWGDDGIAGKVNSGFIAARVVDRQREDGKNAASIQDLQRRFSIQAFPTLIVADSSGREIARSEGFRDKESVAKFLDDARSAPPGKVIAPQN